VNPRRFGSENLPKTISFGLLDHFGSLQPILPVAGLWLGYSSSGEFIVGVSFSFQFHQVHEL